MKTYTPQPIDTSKVELNESLLPLTEQLAEHVHDKWAIERIAQGWSYGPHRDDVKKEHPSLVPYGDLPEKEKVFDRNTAIETMKLVLSLGWRIEGGPK